MRPVSEVTKNRDRNLDGIVEDTVLDFIDADTETDVDLQSSPLFCSENKMAAVFPSLASSDKGVTTLTKILTVSKTQTKSEPMEGFSETVSSISKSVIAVKEQKVVIDSTDGNRRVNHRNNNNNNNIPSCEIQNDEARNGSHDCKKHLELKDYVTEKPVSSFHNTVVEALVEEQKAGVTGKTGEKCMRNVRYISDDSDTGVLDNEKCYGNGCVLTASGDLIPAVQMAKLPPCSPSGTSCSRTVSLTKESAAVVNKTRASRGDSLASSVEERALSAYIERGDVADGCPVLLSEEPKCLSSVIDFQKPSATNFSEQPMAQKNTPQLSDDVITTEAESQTPRSHKFVKTTCSGQDGAEDVKQRLSARISKSLVNFFQRRPFRKPVMSDSINGEGQGRTSSSAAARSHRKDASQQSSFSTKLKTSMANWRHKHPMRRKSLSRERKGTGTDVEDKHESPNNNKRRVPLFVSPQEQVDIFDDAPEGILQEQKIVLRESWSIIKSDVAEVGVEAFMGLFHTHPDSIDSFLAFKDKSIEDIEQSAVLKAHALRVMQTVDKCVTRLDDIDKMAAVLCQLGRRHIGYRANASLVPIIGKQFISAIEPKMADKWSDDVNDAWDALFRTINYNMRAGMMQEKRRLEAEGVITKRK